MVMLASLPEDYFQNNPKYKKKLFKDNNDCTIGEIRINHFKSSYEPYKIYTFIKGEINLGKDKDKTRYELSVDFNENTLLEDFEIEYDKVVRKWERIMKYIINDIEVVE